MSETQIALVTHEYLDSLRNLQSTKETHHVTGNTTISATYTVIIEDVLENDEIIANAKRLLRDGCGCSHGMKGALCCPQFLEKLLLSNQNNCLELTRAELYSNTKQYQSIRKNTTLYFNYPPWLASTCPF